MARLSLRNNAPKLIMAVVIAVVASLVPASNVSAAPSISLVYVDNTRADLTWDKADTSDVVAFRRYEILRDGALIVTFTDINVLFYRDETLNKGQTYTYQLRVYRFWWGEEHREDSLVISVTTGQVHGTITKDTIWTPSNGTYNVNSLNVSSGITLVIQSGTDIQLQGSSFHALEGTVIAESATFHSTSPDGGVVEAGPRSRIKNCVSDSISFTVSGYGTGNPMVQILDNTIQGGSVSARGKVTISGNKVNNGAIYLSEIRGATVVSITNNTINGSTGAWGGCFGISLDDNNSSATLTGNALHITDNGGISISGRSTATLEMHQNTFCGTGWFAYALNNGSSMVINATQNYWGDASGPRTGSNPGGTGLPVFGDNVQYVPFVTAGSCTPDLTISGVQPIQVIDGAAFVAGKKTAFRVFVNLTGGGTLSGDVRLKIEGTGGTSYSNSWQKTGTFRSIYTTKDKQNVQDSVNFLGINLPAGSYRLTATVDPDNAIQEASETNNSASTVVTAVATKRKNILYTAVIVNGYSTPNASSFKDQADRLLETMYPIAEGSIYSEVGPAMHLNSIPVSGAQFIATKLEVWRHLTNSYNADHGRTQFDFNVGIIPEDLSNNLFWLTSQFEGASYLGREHSPLVLEQKVDAVVHELGHYYGLSDEYYRATCLWCSDHQLENVTIYDASEGREGNLRYLSPPPTNIICMMGAAGKLWIEASCYNTLYDRLLASSSYDPSRILLVSGAVHRDDTVDFDQWYTFSGASYTIDTPPPGDYSIQCLSDNGTILNSVSFGVSFTANTNPPTEVDVAPFVLSIEYPLDTARVVIKHSTTVLKTRNVSPNTPTVRVISPNGGDNITASTNITWTGSDIDSDNLSYSVLYSNNGGAGWQVLADNLTATSFNWDTRSSPGGTNCLVKVIATDSINTGADTSDGFFTVANRAPLVSIIQPSDNSTFSAGSPVHFQGCAYDPEQGTLTGSSLVWSSNVTGISGNGTAFDPVFSPGSYTINLTATDNTSLSGNKSIRISVVNDTTSPVIRSVSLSPSPVVRGQAVTVSVNATDDVAIATQGVEVSLQEDKFCPSYITSVGLYRCSIPAPSNTGNYPVGVTVTDAAGNSTFSTATLSVVIIPPDVTTDNATNVSATSALLNGTLNSPGSSSNATLSFQWGTSTNYTSETSALTTNATGAFSIPLTGLSENTTYHYRAKAVGDAVVYGGDKTFTTSAFNLSRHLPGYTSKGQTFQVSINFTAPSGGFNSLTISDFVPISWNATADKTWCTPAPDRSQVTGNRVDYFWNSSNVTYPQGTALTVVYQVTVPSGANPGMYSFGSGYLEYYNGTGQGPFTAGIGGDYQVQVVVGAQIGGTTWEVKGLVLAGVTVTLNGSSNVTSDGNGNYQIVATTAGSHTMVASKTGYRNVTQTVNVTQIGATYTVDFKGIHGLVPNRPDLSYVLACINRWKFPPTDGTGLDLSKVLSVINAWKFPI